jgi:hypothetical protein
MSVTWFGVTLTFEFGWASNPSVAIGSTSWTDESSKARGFSTKRGRNDETGTFQPGTATITLDNRDRRFDPNYAAGALFGNLLPMRRVRIKATYNAVTYDVWSGFIDDIPQAYDRGNKDATVTISCTDGFKVLSRLKLPESAYAVQIPLSNPTAWWRLGEQSGTQAVDSSVNSYDGIYVGGATFNSTTGLLYGASDSAIAFDGVDDYIIANAPLTGYPFTIEGWGQWTAAAGNGAAIYTQRTLDGVYRISVVGQADGSVLAEAVDPGLFGISTRIQAITTSTAFGNGQPHHIMATFASDTAAPLIYVDGAAMATTTVLDGTITFPASGSVYIGLSRDNPAGLVAGMVDEVAVYNGVVLTATDAANHYAYGSAPYNGDGTGARINRLLDLTGWPSADRTIATGLSTLQPLAMAGATIFSKLQDVEASEQGQFFMGADGKVIFRDRHWRFENSLAITSNATFGDGAGELDYSDIVTDGGEQFVANHVRASREFGATTDVTDATSITKFYEVIDEVSGLQNQSDLEIRDLANWRLGTRKNPVQRVTVLEIRPRRDPTNLFPLVLGQDIGYRETVKRRPQNVGAVLSYAVLVEGIEHSVTPKGEWVTRWYLSSLDSQTAMQPLILDSTPFGLLDTGVLAY